MNPVQNVFCGNTRRLIQLKPSDLPATFAVDDVQTDIQSVFQPNYNSPQCFPHNCIHKAILTCSRINVNSAEWFCCQTTYMKSIKPV